MSLDFINKPKDGFPGRSVPGTVTQSQQMPTSWTTSLVNAISAILKACWARSVYFDGTTETQQLTRGHHNDRNEARNFSRTTGSWK
eukprot:scaffold1319_cov126-Cylindrotheca_fusiformis.AAC.19